MAKVWSAYIATTIRMSYTKSMSKFITFQLDTAGGQDILTNMAMATINQSAQAIKGRAESMVGSMSSKPPTISVTTHIGTIRRGRRAIATVTASGGLDAHANYIGRMALVKAKDAGRV